MHTSTNIVIKGRLWRNQNWNKIAWSICPLEISIQKERNQIGHSYTRTHHGEERHSKQRCYEIIVYPEWWDFIKKPRKKVNQAADTNTSLTEEVTTTMVTNAQTNSDMFHHDQSWIIDIGASDHMKNDRSKVLKTYTPKLNKMHATNGSEAPIIGEGPVKVSNSVNLDSVLVVPTLLSNLLSVSQITEALNCM